MSATKAMGDLKTFWDNTYVDTYSKYLIFQDITIKNSFGDTKHSRFVQHLRRS